MKLLSLFSFLVCLSTVTLTAVAQKTTPDKSKPGADNPLAQTLSRSTNYAQQKQVFDLRYQLTAGEVIRWDVEQVAKTDAAIAGFKEQTSMRSRSTIAWKVLSVDSRGKMTFQDTLESAKEWQKVGDADPVSYDSQSDTDVPDIYLSTAEKIGKPIATTTIDPKGNIIDRIEHFRTAEFGMGRVTLPLPDGPVKIGQQWHTPDELKARHDDGRIKHIKTRILYTLREVKDGIAIITFRREILTPVKEARIKSQLQQKMNQGDVHFDIAAGRVIQKRVQWDETAQGFEGPDSYLQYLGSYTKTINTQSPNNTPAKPANANRASQIIKPRDGKPIIRK